MQKVRLDVLLVERGLVESRSLAQRQVMAGQVRVDEQVVFKPSVKVSSNAALTVESRPRFVSRGGEKLDSALESFQIDAGGCICADVGASTGGFTDCLLQRGAARVYAIDVGKGILHWKMRGHPGVVVMEATNARRLEKLPEPVDLVTIDASFISLKVLLPVVKNWFSASRSGKEQGEIVALIKPQFEAGRRDVSRGDGVIRNPEIHRQVLEHVLAFAQSQSFGLKGLVKSPLLGPKGNTEFLVWLDLAETDRTIADLIMGVLGEEHGPELS
ncbi:MAG: TlyA family RNA methyltransferase [Anaerolineales bacterium]|nr:TlyA family RNA methyltransferase [Anaerolineales bacterium]